MRSYWTYILASKPRGTLYIGVTNGLPTRVEQHGSGKGSAFARKYDVHALVWFEEFANVREAIQREKTLKHYVRAWKINLIERTNPHWVDCIRHCRASLRFGSLCLAERWILGTSQRMTTRVVLFESKC